MIRQYERRGGALVLVEYYDDDDPAIGEAVVPEVQQKENEPSKNIENVVTAE